MQSDWDIFLGVAILLAVSHGTYCLGKQASRKAAPAVAQCLAAVVLAATAFFAVFLHGKLWLAKLLPLCNVIVLGNWIPVGAASLAGIVMGQGAIPVWRRATVAIVVAGLAWSSVIRDVCGLPRGSDKAVYVSGFPLQTGDASCSSACAAELLRCHGIQATEAEMRRLCLTRDAGTPELGLYRGLKLKTDGTGWAVRIMNCSVEDLVEKNAGPLLALVDVEGTSTVGSRRWDIRRYLRRANHSIIVYRYAGDGYFAIGEPVAGRTRIDREDLAKRWCWTAIRIVPLSVKPSQYSRSTLRISPQSLIR